MKRSLSSLSLSVSVRVLAVILFGALAFAQSDEIVPNENLVARPSAKLVASILRDIPSRG